MYGILAKLTALRYDRRAVTALEYGLIASLIAVAIITAVSSLGSNLSSTFSTIASHFVAGKVTT
jgi:pilus assembly protein Flp/PilA